jgi:hypothetical protein
MFTTRKESILYFTNIFRLAGIANPPPLPYHQTLILQAFLSLSQNKTGAAKVRLSSATANPGGAILLPLDLQLTAPCFES